MWSWLFAILQKYDFSSKSQRFRVLDETSQVVCDTAKVRFFKQITTEYLRFAQFQRLFAILQKYDFSSKSQRRMSRTLRSIVVCDTAKVRFFKQITTRLADSRHIAGCLRYCKSTIFQANHNRTSAIDLLKSVVCDTAKVRFFKQITTHIPRRRGGHTLFAILQKYDFSSKSQRVTQMTMFIQVVCDTAKVRFFKQITTI